MLKKGERYTVQEDLFNFSVDLSVEKNLSNDCFSGKDFAACFTSNDLLILIQSCSTLINSEHHIKKDSIIEIINVEYNNDDSIYHPEDKVSYIEFRLYFKVNPDDTDFMVYQNLFGWNYIREDKLKKIPKHLWKCW